MEFIVPGKNGYLCYISITGHGSAQLALNGVNNNVDTDDLHSFHLIMRVNVELYVMAISKLRDTRETCFVLSLRVSRIEGWWRYDNNIVRFITSVGL